MVFKTLSAGLINDSAKMRKYSYFNALRKLEVVKYVIRKTRQ